MLRGRFAGLANLGLRGATLVLRFALSFYIIKFLGYEATGIFGLAVGAVGLTPAIIGWGLNYFVCREVVGLPRPTALLRVKTRLIVTFTSLSVATLLFLIGAAIAGFDVTPVYWMIIALLWLETLALDLHLPLIGMEMSLQGNVLVFVRTALWVPIVVAIGYFYPETRSLNVVFGAWIISGVASLLTLYLMLRKWPLAQAFSARPEYTWIKERLRHSWLIYVSDLGLVGLAFIDRYIVSFLLGLAQTGIYTFYWSLMNALQTLVSTSVIQLALPVLVRAHREGSPERWRAALRGEFIKVSTVSAVLAVAIFGASEVIIHFLGMPALKDHRGLFVLMLLSAVIRASADVLNVGLTSIGRDQSYALTNIIGVFLSCGLAFAGGSAFGLVGFGIAALTTSICLLLIRLAYLTRNINQTKAVGVGAAGQGGNS